MKLLEMIGLYQELLDKKDELKDRTKKNNEEIEAMKAAIAEEMIDTECPKISHGGYTFSLADKTIYSKKSEEALHEAGVDFLETLRDQGLGSIIVERVEPRTLQSTMKNIVEEQGALPEELLEVLNVYDTYDITRRKETNKALAKAKEA